MKNNKKDKKNWILDEDGDKLIKKTEFNLSNHIEDDDDIIDGKIDPIYVREFIARLKANIYPLIKPWELVYEINQEIDNLAGDKLT